MNLSLGSGAAFLLAALACACGGSSEGAGAGGAPTGGGPGSSGGSGSNGGAGSSGRSSSGSSGSSAAGNDDAGNSGSSTCPAAAPCGGNLVGDWTIDRVCLNTQTLGFNQACPGQSISISQLTASGTVSFKADGSMTSSGMISFHESAQLPASCVSELECTTFANSLSSSSTVTDSQCAYDAVTGCSCTLISSQPSMSSGTYAVQGTSVTLTNSSSGKAQMDTFCVSGNTATLYQQDASGTSSVMTLRK